MRNLWLACCVAAVFGVTTRAVDERTLTASHIGIVTVTDARAVAGDKQRVTVEIDESIRGDWRFSVEVELAITATAGALSKDEQLLVFCVEAIEPGRGVIYCAGADSIVRIADPASEQVIDDTRKVMAQIGSLLRETRGKAPSETGRDAVANLVEKLLVRETQRDAVKGILALPAENNTHLVEYVYDFRRVPSGLLSPDDPIVFHQSPVRRCRYVHDAIVWLLQERTGKYFGHGDERSTLERRVAVGESWHYWIACGSAGAPRVAEIPPASRMDRTAEGNPPRR